MYLSSQTLRQVLSAKAMSYVGITNSGRYLYANATECLYSKEMSAGEFHVMITRRCDRKVEGVRKANKTTPLNYGYNS